MKRILFVLLFFNFCTNLFHAKTYYISVSGNDTSSGLSIAKAWSSITPQTSGIYLLMLQTDDGINYLKLLKISYLASNFPKSFKAL